MKPLQVLPDTLIKPFGTLISCRDTVDSECLRNLSREQCVEYCKNNPFCACGYFLEPKTEASYCVPLNSTLLKNMNLHLNTYPLEKDPTKQLWKSSAVFFRPDIYPMKTDTKTIIMQKDICHFYYKYKGSNYYMQSDFSFLKNGKATASKILFIDKYPQFYELANTVQNYSTFVIKLFAEPKVLSVVDKNKLGAIPYLTLSGEQEVPDLTLFIPGKMETPLDYKLLTFDSSFQILTNKRKSIIEVSKESNGKLTMGIFPFKESQHKFKGSFQVEREAIQPNIYKVAQILPARLVFLRDSIDFPSSPTVTQKFLVGSIVLLGITLLLVILFSILRRRKEVQQQKSKSENFRIRKDIIPNIPYSY